MSGFYAAAAGWRNQSLSLVAMAKRRAFSDDREEEENKKLHEGTEEE